jgi:hypothetical protein
MRRLGGSVRMLSFLLAAATAGALAAATHPARASATLAALATAVKCATTAACVSGSNASTGAGVAGSSAKGTGVTGTGLTGLSGMSVAGNGVAGTSQTGTGVYGTATAPNRGAGVVGVGRAGTSGGVAGTSVAGDGLYGASTSGIGSYAFSASGTGALGQSTTGTGVVASSQGSDALVATNDGFGDAILTTTSDGVAVNAFREGNADNPTVLADDESGTAGEFIGTTIGLVGRAAAGTASFPLLLTDRNDNDLFYVDGAGDVYYAGTLNRFAATPGGATARVFTPTSAAPTIEDTGTAQLVAGAASVRLDPVFAASIDTTTAYRVFLTPDGDTRGLYVAAKTRAGFVVRESEGGRTTTAFDYRVVAAALGQAGERMSLSIQRNASRPPAYPVHRHVKRPLPTGCARCLASYLGRR